jgi:hypothetical protein
MRGAQAARGAHPAAHQPRLSTARPTPLPSRTAQSSHQPRLGVDDLGVAHPRSLGPNGGVSTSPSALTTFAGALCWNALCQVIGVPVA